MRGRENYGLGMCQKQREYMRNKKKDEIGMCQK